MRLIASKIFQAPVRSSSDVSTGQFELPFYSPDASRKALCMNGYNVAGGPLIVTAVKSPTDTIFQENRQTDSRRNLYVLGLPFDFTKAEFSHIFSAYGVVSHCVILATHDNSSRRRGFVVMSNHEEAKEAMRKLSRTEIRGHTLDISWAVVQRSQGFLDGGDRTVVLDSRPSHDASNLLQPPSTASIVSSLDSNAATASHPMSTILVSNLPKLLFSTEEDLHPLLYPFGSIEKLDVLNSSASSQDVLTAVVRFTSPSNAMDAKASLHGQIYANRRLSVEHIQTDPSTGAFLGPNSLNPFALPFVFDAHARSNSPLAPAAQYRHLQQQNSSFSSSQHGLPNSQDRKLQSYRSLHYTASQYDSVPRYPSSFSYKPFNSQAWSRSSSTSSQWSNDSSSTNFNGPSFYPNTRA